MSRAVITGVGIVDALGNNLDQCFNNLLNDTDPIKAITKINFEQFPNLKIKIGAEISMSYVDASMHTVNQALEHAGLDYSENVAVFYNSLGGDSLTRLDYMTSLASGKSRYSPRAMLPVQLDYISGHIAQTIGATGHNVTTNTGCSSFLTSLDYACRVVDEYDYVVVGGSDTVVDPTHVWWFQQFQALSPDHSRPFDHSRNGFVLGDGAGCIILESETKARARGAHILGIVSGIGIASDNNTTTGLNSQGARLSLQRALKNANVKRVDFISAHATSTLQGDDIEYQAMKESLPGVPMYSAKAKIGHTMAACGAIELIYGLASLEHNIIPRTYGLINPLANDPALLIENLETPCQSFIKNSYAFGGRCVSAVIEKDYE